MTCLHSVRMTRDIASVPQSPLLTDMAMLLWIRIWGLWYSHMRGQRSPVKKKVSCWPEFRKQRGALWSLHTDTARHDLTLIHHITVHLLWIGEPNLFCWWGKTKLLFKGSDNINRKCLIARETKVQFTHSVISIYIYSALSHYEYLYWRWHCWIKSWKKKIIRCDSKKNVKSNKWKDR